jgi:hypothetical protein
MQMASTKRILSSGTRTREVDIYSGFNKNLTTLLDEENHEDEAYQSALKVSSYGKRTTTPKNSWVVVKVIKIL